MAATRPRLAECIGVTPGVLRYREEQQLISPAREHGKLRHSPRGLTIAALIRRLPDADAGGDGDPDAQATRRTRHLPRRRPGSGAR